MQDYEGGLFGCFNDFPICIFTTFCMPCQNAKNWAKARKFDCTWMTCCEPVHPYWVRYEILNGNPGEVTSCLLSTFCSWCTVCQDARKLGSKIDDVPSAPTA